MVIFFSILKSVPSLNHFCYRLYLVLLGWKALVSGQGINEVWPTEEQEKKSHFPLGKPHWERRRVYSGIAQMGEGGGLNPCPNGLGHLFWEELSMFKGAFSYFWGVWTLARIVWGTYAVKIEVQMAFAQVGLEIKCPRVPVWVKGGGCNRYLGNAQIDPAFFYLGLPLHSRQLRTWIHDNLCYLTIKSDTGQHLQFSPLWVLHTWRTIYRR